MATVVETYVVGPNGKPTIKKDPNAVLDYSLDWSKYLAPLADTLTSAVFTSDNGTVVESSTYTSSSARAVVSGGTVGSTATLTCRITTVGGRTDDRSVYLKIVER